MAGVTKPKLDQLAAITAELKPLEERREALREKASQLAVQLLRAGIPPTEVANHAPFSAAHLRTLARIAGIPPAKRGRKGEGPHQ